MLLKYQFPEPVQYPVTTNLPPEVELFIRMAKQHHVPTNLTLTPCNQTKYLHPQWLNIPCFLKAISGLKRGEQHRTCHDVIMSLKDRWELTIQYNTNQDIHKLIRLFNLLSLSHSLGFPRDERDGKFSKAHMGTQILDVLSEIHQPYAQMFSTMSYVFGQQSREDITTITTNLTKATDRIDNVTKLYHEFVVGLHKYFSNFIKIGSIVLMLSKVFSFTYLVCIIKFTRTQLAALITLLLPTEVGSVLTSVSDELIRAVQTINAYFTQPVAQAPPNAHSLFGSFFSMIKLMFVHSCSPIDKPVFEQMTLDTANMRNVSEFLRSCNNIWVVLTKAISFVFECARERFIASCGYLPSYFSISDEVDCISKFISDYDSVFATHLDASATSTASAAIVIELLTRARKLELDIYHDSLQITGAFTKMRVLPLLRCAIVHLQKVVGDIPPHVRNGFEGFRRKPFWVFIHGSSSIGKSSIIQPIIANMLAAKLNLVDSFDDPHNYSYYRTCGAKFYSCYRGQPITQYQDLFQFKGDEEGLDAALMEITMSIDEAPYELNMPDVESKGKVFFTSSIVLSNSQQDIIGLPFITNRCLSGGIHIYRRRNLVIEPVLNPKYASVTGIGIDPKYNSIPFVPSRYADFLPNDLYDFIFTDPITGTIVHQNPLDSGLDYILECAERHLNQQSDLHKKLHKSLETTFNRIRTTPPIIPIPTGTPIAVAHMLSTPHKSTPTTIVMRSYYLRIRNLVPRIISPPIERTINMFLLACPFTDHASIDLVNSLDQRFETIVKELMQLPHATTPIYLNTWEKIVDKFEQAHVNSQRIQRDSPPDPPPIPPVNERAAECTASVLSEYLSKHPELVIDATPEKVDKFLNCEETKKLIETLRHSEHLPPAQSQPHRTLVNSLARTALTSVDPRTAISKLWSWSSDHVKYVSSFLYRRNVNELIDDALDFHDAPLPPVTCDCLNRWTRLLTAHPLLYNDTETREVLMYIMNQKHAEYCGTIFRDSDDMITNMFIELLYNNVLTYRQAPTYRINKVFRNFASYFNDRFNATKRTALSKFGEHPWIVPLSIAAGMAVGVGMLVSTMKNSKSDLHFTQEELDNLTFIVDPDPVVVTPPDDDPARAQTHEGNNKAKRIRIARHKTETDIAKAHYDSTNRQTEQVLRNNIITFRLCLVIDNELVEQDLYMNGLAVAGSMFVLPRHFWHTVEQVTAPRVIRIYWPNQTFQNVEISNIQVYQPSHEQLQDIVFLNIPRMCSKRDVRHFFISEKDDVDQTEAYLYGKSRNDYVLMSVDNISLVALRYLVESQTTTNGQVIPETEVSVPTVYKYYNAKTQPGDCGALLVFVNPRLNSRTVAGMHVAGVTSSNIGYSVPLFQEDLNEAFKHFDSLNRIIYSAPPAFAQMTSSLTPMGEDLASIGANVVGRTGKLDGKYVCMTVSRKTRIKPSLIQDQLIEDLGPNVCAPARLRPFTNPSGDTVSPLLTAYKKLNRMCPNMVPNRLYDQILDHVAATNETLVSPYTTDHSLRRVLNDDEMINGITGLKQLDLTTSPGFPYIYINSNSGKRPWFEIDRTEECGFVHYKCNEHLLGQINERIALASLGIKKETYFVDALKDEPRELEKVQLGKTRLFQIAPMDLNIALRKYFGSYIAHLSMTYIDGECAVGVNCLSEEWHYMFKDFTLPYDYDSDARDFDASTSHQIGMFYADSANRFYDDGPENALIRCVLIATVFESLHIVGDAIVESLQGNKSGIVATTHVNDSTNQFSNRFAYAQRPGFVSFQHYLTTVRNKFYGDDVRGNTSLAWFTTDYLKEKLAIIGFDITPACKDSKDVALTFLKRTNHYNPQLRLNTGLLHKKVIEEIARWCESDPTLMRDQMQRFNASLNEAALHGPEYHQKLHSVYFRSCVLLLRSHYVIDPTQLLSYSQAMHNMFPNQFSPLI